MSNVPPAPTPGTSSSDGALPSNGPGATGDGTGRRDVEYLARLMFDDSPGTDTSSSSSTPPPPPPVSMCSPTSSSTTLLLRSKLETLRVSPVLHGIRALGYDGGDQSGHADDRGGVDPVTELGCDIVDTLAELNQRNHSLHNILRHLAAKRGADMASWTPVARNLLGQIVLAYIGCLTGWFTTPVAAGSDHIEVRSYGSAEVPPLSRKDMSIATRPLMAMLRSMGVRLPLDVADYTPGGGIGALGADLCVADLHVAVLTRQLGEYNMILEWVDDLRCHLQFDSHSRTLYVYRHPSLCALYCGYGQVPSFFQRALVDSQRDGHTRVSIDTHWHHEVIMSLRVLFSQTPSSRKLFTRNERPKATKNGFLDPLLARLCGHAPALDACGTATLGRVERERYPVSEWRALGPRMAAVRDFVERHRVVRVRDRWRDRADRGEWVAFWTLLTVGILSIVLSVVQIALAGAQLQAQLVSNNESKRR